MEYLCRGRGKIIAWMARDQSHDAFRSVILARCVCHDGKGLIIGMHGYVEAYRHRSHRPLCYSVIDISEMHMVWAIYFFLKSGSVIQRRRHADNIHYPRVQRNVKIYSSSLVSTGSSSILFSNQYVCL